MTTPEPLTDEWFALRGESAAGCLFTHEGDEFSRHVAAAALRWAAEDATKYELSENTTIGGVRERERAERELLIAADRLRAKAAEIEGSRAE